MISTTIGEIESIVLEALGLGGLIIRLPDSQSVDGFKLRDLVKPVDSNFGAPIRPFPAPDFLAYMVAARDPQKNTVSLVMVDSMENVICTATRSNLVPGSRFYVHKTTLPLLPTPAPGTLKTIGDIQCVVIESPPMGILTIQLLPYHTTAPFLPGDLVRAVGAHSDAPISPSSAPGFHAYKVLSTSSMHRTVYLEMVDGAENIIRTSAGSNLMPGHRFYVHKTTLSPAPGTLMPWPPTLAVASDRWPPSPALWNPENWGETPETQAKNKQRCPKDSHKHADTGMRVSYCVRCNAKLSFENWEWKEIEG